MSTETMTFGQYFGNIYTAVRTSLKGMWITFKYVWNNKTVTIEYPEVREVLPERARMRLYNDVKNCIACNMCALSCPVDCIYISSVKRPKDLDVPKTEDGTAMRQVLTQYVIDTALCCYCGLCTTVCPTQCLTHTKDYEFAQYTCNDMMYDYMDEEIIAWRDRLVVK